VRRVIAVRLSRRRSWHLANSSASLRTLCGRGIPQAVEMRAERPASEASCENCYRVHERRERLVNEALSRPVDDDDPLAGTVAPI